MTVTTTATTPSAARTYPSLRAAWIPLSALCLAFFVEMVDNTLLSIALPTIRRDLGSGTTGLQWVTGVYSLTFGGLLLTAGSMADRLGRRPAEESQHCGSQTGHSARSLDRDRDRARAAARMRA